MRTGWKNGHYPSYFLRLTLKFQFVGLLKGFACILFLSQFSVYLWNETYADPPVPSTRRVAIIFNAPERAPFGNLRAEQTQSLYLGAGYRVLLLSASGGAFPATIAGLGQAFDTLTNAVELTLTFIAHGTGLTTEQVSALPASLQRRYAFTEQSPAVAAVTAGRDRMPPPHQTRLAFWMPSGEVRSGQPSGLAELLETSVGVTDLRDLIQRAQQRNPGLRVNLIAQNCFSGLLGLAFADTPNVQVIASTASNFEGSGRSDPAFANPSDPREQYVDYVRLMNQGLEQGLSFQQAYTKVFNWFFDRIESTPPPVETQFGTFPRSALQLYVQNWCRSRAEESTLSRVAPRSTLAPPPCRESRNSLPLQETVNVATGSLRDLALFEIRQPANRILDYFRSRLGAFGCNRPEARARMREDEVASAVALRQVVGVIVSRLPAYQSAIRETTPESFSRRVTMSEQESTGRGGPGLQLPPPEMRGQMLQNLKQISTELLTAVSSVCVGSPGRTVSVTIGPPFEPPHVESLSCEGLLERFAYFSTFFIDRSGAVDFRHCQRELPPEQRYDLNANLTAGTNFRSCLSASFSSAPFESFLALRRRKPLALAVCDTIENHLLPYEEDLTCAERFRRHANDAEWRRFEELVDLGQRSVRAP